jgi:phage shock protein A
MGFFKKLSDIARSNINNLLDNLEDPKKMAEQAVLDLEESKNKAKNLLIKAQGRIKLLEQKMQGLRELASSLVKDAEDMLKKADEEEARKILVQKQAITDEKNFYENELKLERQTVNTINNGLRAIDNKISELKLSNKNIAQNTINNNDAFANFSRMEEKIETNEFEILALKELEQDQKKDAIEIASYDKHSDPKSLEEELLAIKKKI